MGGGNKLPWQLSKRICLQGNHAVLLKSEMHNTTSTWKLSLKGMCTGKSEIFYKFKLMKHSCWFTNVSHSNYSTQRQKLNNFALYICIFQCALWLELSGLYQSSSPALPALRESPLPSLYKLLLTQILIYSDPKKFNPFLVALLFLMTVVSQNFLTSNIRAVKLQKKGWQKGEFQLKTLLGKAVPPI